MKVMRSQIWHDLRRAQLRTHKRLGLLLLVLALSSFSSLTVAAAESSFMTDKLRIKSLIFDPDDKIVQFTFKENTQNFRRSRAKLKRDEDFPKTTANLRVIGISAIDRIYLKIAGDGYGPYWVLHDSLDFTDSDEWRRVLKDARSFDVPICATETAALKPRDPNRVKFAGSRFCAK